ncbi:hypothetical protein FOBRF1_007022 [Fusarium oxysporum]
MGSHPPSGPVCRVVASRFALFAQLWFSACTYLLPGLAGLLDPIRKLFHAIRLNTRHHGWCQRKEEPPRRPKKDPKNTTTDPNDADPLAENLGDRAASLLPKEVLGIETRTFAYRVEQPESNLDLTVWALINALKGGTTNRKGVFNKFYTILRQHSSPFEKELETTSGIMPATRATLQDIAADKACMDFVIGICGQLESRRGLFVCGDGSMGLVR